jgi:type II secretory pathway component GspD/PulD (secretin)
MRPFSHRLIAAGGLAALLCILFVQAGPAQGPKKEKELSFQTNSIPWKELFNWLSDRTGMPVLKNTAKFPTGSLDIISPKETKYTLPQVMDIINDNLMEQKFLLVRRPRSFVLVSSEKKLPPSLVPRLADVKELQKRGQSEVVSLKLQPTVIVDDISAELKKLQGPFGDMVVLPQANQLIIQDTVENLERILTHISDIEKTVKAKVENNFEVIKLKYASAVEVAKILEDGFNGTKTAGAGAGPGPAIRGRGRGPGGGNFGGDFPFGGGEGFPGLWQPKGGGGAGGTGERKDRIRVIADAATNQLLVKADPADLAAIKTLISKNLDVKDTDNDQKLTLGRLGGRVPETKNGEPVLDKDRNPVYKMVRVAEVDDNGKPVLDKKGQPKYQMVPEVGPLLFTNADDIASVIRDVYRESMNQNPISRFPFGQNLKMGIDPYGNAKGVQLSLGVDNRTNMLIVSCPRPLKKELQELVFLLEDAAQTATAVSGTQVVEFVKVKGGISSSLQQAIDAMQGRRTNTGPTGGMNNGGGIFPFGGGFGPRPGGFGPPGGGGGRFRGPGGMQSRGPDFFVPAVKDDHRATATHNLKNHRKPADLHVSLDPEDGNVMVLVEAAEMAQVLQPGGKDKGKGPPPKAGIDQKGKILQFPRGTFEIIAIPGTGRVIIRASNAQDLEALKAIVAQLSEGGQEIKIVPLRHADATSVATTLNQLYSQMGGVRPPTQAAQPVQPQVGPGGQPFPQPQPQPQPQQQQAQAAATAVVLIPLPRFNGILVAASKDRLEEVESDILRMDQPNVPATQAVPFGLKRASAAKVANTINNFYNDRYSPEQRAQHLIRVFSDDSSNTVYVQAAPADLVEIKSLIERLDSTESPAINDVRVRPLRNAVSDDLATIILRAIAEGPITPGSPGQTTGAGGAPTPAGPAGPGGAPFQAPGAVPGAVPGAAGVGAAQQQRQSKGISLSFISTRPGGPKLLTGILDDIRITSDPRTNSLIISAPEKTMKLILALIDDLDVPPLARAEINVFPLKYADATQMALQLQTLFLGTTGAGTGIPRTAAPGTPPGGGVPGGGVPGGGIPGGGAGTGTGRPLQIVLQGQTPEGAPLIDLRITVDEQTNSIIAAGSKNDLFVIYNILNRIDDADRAKRKNGSIRLHNAMVADVAATLTDFFTKGLTVYRTGNTLSNYWEIQRDVALSTDPITNTLLINASPPYFDEVVELAHRLDFLPQQVVIQVMVGECDYEDEREIGVELGLQSPVLFRRSIFTPPTTGPALVPQGVSVNNFTNPPGLPGFLFNDVTQALGNNTGVTPGIVGFQSITNLGTGQISPNNSFGGFVFHASSNSVSVLVRALEVQKRIKILSRPEVMTLDNQTALINVSKSVPLNAGSVATATGVVSSNIVRQTVGVILQVTPKITLDGQVVMRIIPEISSVDPQQITLGNGQTGTVLNIQHLETTAVADDGETIVLGGMITDNLEVTTNKVPCLGDLPGIGWMFRYRTTDRKKVELLLIMTPHIINGRKDTERILAEEAAKMGWNVKEMVNYQGWSGMDPVLQGVKPPAELPFGPGSILPAPRFIPGPAEPGPSLEPLPQPRTLPGSVFAPLLHPNARGGLGNTN